jgi:hypothetical protein
MDGHNVEDKISQFLINQLSKRDLALEVGRFIFTNEIFKESNSIHFWVIKQNIRQITETTLDLELFPDYQVNVTFVNPSFFLDVFENIGDIPFWQIATVKRVLVDCKIIYDPQSFIAEMVKKSKTLEWSPEIITLKKNVAEQLLQKAQSFIKQDMLADAYMWGIKAVEEAICSQLMINNAFNVTTPSLLLSSMRDKPYLMKFYLEILGIDILTPDLTLIALKELENLADHIYHSSIGSDREQWVLAGFVSINEAERKIMKVLEKASDESIDILQWEYIFEDAVVELWQSFFILAQTPWKKDVPLDPWVVGLFWKWHVNENPQYDINQIIDRCQLILKTGDPRFDWEK